MTMQHAHTPDTRRRSLRESTDYESRAVLAEARLDALRAACGRYAATLTATLADYPDIDGRPRLEFVRNFLAASAEDMR